MSIVENIVIKEVTMKKVLILGKTGFVGRNVYEKLNKGYEVYAPSHMDLDVLCEHSVYNYLKKIKPDIVINAIDLHNQTNRYFEDRLRIFHNLVKQNDMYEKMIFFGSGAEYGRTLPIENIKEDQIGRIVPEDTYGFCLYQMTGMARHSDNIYNLRLFGIFGKYELWEKRFISNAICKALCGYAITIRKNTLFDYLCIDDLCDIIVWVMENELQYHDYNAVSGRRYSLLELAKEVKEQVGTDVPIYMADNKMGKEYTASNERLISEMTCFQAEEMKLSIQKLLQYYQANIDIIDKEKILYN